VHAETRTLRANSKITFLRRGERVALRRIAPGDQKEFTELVEASKSLHYPWILAPSTADEFEKYIGRFDQNLAEGFVICLSDTGSIVGFVNINEIVRGPYQRGVIGYGAFTSTVGLGYMTDGLRLLLDFAFSELKLHRIEADIQPDNTTSLNLAKRLNFRLEGFSPGFICINGKWMDHERWAITNEMMGMQSP
jgi:ribosomal-protein-alanine N-acetyltransferase